LLLFGSALQLSLTGRVIGYHCTTALHPLLLSSLLLLLLLVMHSHQLRPCRDFILGFNGILRVHAFLHMVTAAKFSSE